MFGITFVFYAREKAIYMFVDIPKYKPRRRSITAKLVIVLEVLFFWKSFLKETIKR